MCSQFNNFTVFLIIAVIQVHAIRIDPPKQCDRGGSLSTPEGNIGESPKFPWLGVLRIHMHEGDSIKIALSGIVLIHYWYALGFASDLDRIPSMVLKSDTKAMFISSEGAPWFCKVKSVTPHPEYEFSTYSTLALIELAFDDEQTNPITPICLPNYSFNTSTHLYAVSYTDENMLLEKVIYKLQYVDKELCDEFYKRAKLEGLPSPTYYQCAFAKNNKRHCEWENGMVMASNSTGLWTLVGFGIKSPGCSGPARFIDMAPFVPWINTATSMDDENMLLEKVVYKLQYVDKELCDEFYKRAKLEGLPSPTYYQCAFAKNNKRHCEWENGMVMASNSTGLWTLVGFGIKSPGCSGPARFIDMAPFVPWINTATSMDDGDDQIYDGDVREIPDV